jgi:hypothetical protein
MDSLVHQPTFGVSKHSHAFMIACFGLCPGGRPGGGTGGGAFGASFGFNAGRDGNSGGRRVKLKVPAGEFIIGTFVFKKYHLAECLPACLKTNGQP